MFFIKTLRSLQCAAGRHAKSTVGFALQGGEVEKLRSNFFRLFACFCCRCRVFARIKKCENFLELLLRKNTIFFFSDSNIFFINDGSFEIRIKPLSRIFMSVRRKTSFDSPKGFGAMFEYFAFAFHDEGKGGSLHAAHTPTHSLLRFGLKATSDSASGVHSNKPVTLCSTACGISEVIEIFALSKALKLLTNGVVGHALQPQPAHGLFHTGIIVEFAKNKFAFSPGIACIYQASNCSSIR